MAVGLAVIVVVVVLIIALGGSSSPTTGYDASYPQCSGSYPSNPLFGIVGVNGGLANNANPCISAELHWARDTPGQKRPEQPPLSLYIDTANPGGHHVADWPSGGTTPLYAACNGKLTNACSYLYGEQRAAHSYRLVPPSTPSRPTPRRGGWTSSWRRAGPGPTGSTSPRCRASSPACTTPARPDRSGSTPPAPSGTTSRD
jgi:hypothetical protein